MSKHIEDLKRTIESSKVYMRAIFEKIRYQGKIKIINELNGNPRHPEYQSSFPDLFRFTPKPDNPDRYYPSKRLDEDFDLEGRKNILESDKNFRERMNKNIQESYCNDFIGDGKWQVSNQLQSIQNVRSTIEIFQRKYEFLKSSNHLDESFMHSSKPSLFMINDEIIPIDNQDRMTDFFKKKILNVHSQKLLSIYANEKLLRQSYSQLSFEHPEIQQYQVKNSRNIYKINFLDDGSIKLVATNFSDLDLKNHNDIEQYKRFGIRATVIFPPNNSPIMKYSHFIQ